MPTKIYYKNKNFKKLYNRKKQNQEKTFFIYAFVYIKAMSNNYIINKNSYA